MPTPKPLRPSAPRQVLPAPLLIPESRLELLQGLGEIGPAHASTLRMGAFGVNPIGSTDVLPIGFTPKDPRGSVGICLVSRRRITTPIMNVSQRRLQAAWAGSRSG